MKTSAPTAGLAVVSLASHGDGIAYVGRLLERTLGELYPRAPRIVQLAPGSSDGTTVGERARFLSRMFREQVLSRADFWVFNHLALARVQSVIPRALRAPHIVFLNGIEAWAPGWKSGIRSALAGARGRIAISVHTARRVRSLHPDIGPVHVCPLALLPEEAPDAAAADLAAASLVDERSVLVVGRMSADERYKGHDELLECWGRVRHRIPDARLVIVGSGDDAERLRSKARRLGHSESVHFLGFVSGPTLQAVLSRAGVFAMPSRQEGFGLVYLEAMRARLPCIGSSVDAAGEVIIDGETGLLVDPARPDELSSSLVRLLEDRDLRARMGTAGGARYRAEFTYDAYRERLRAILQEMGL